MYVDNYRFTACAKNLISGNSQNLPYSFFKKFTIFYRITIDKPDLVKSIAYEEPIQFFENENKRIDLVTTFEEEIYDELENKFKKQNNEKNEIIAANSNLKKTENSENQATHYVELNPQNLDSVFRSSFNCLIFPENNDVTHF